MNPWFGDFIGLPLAQFLEGAFSHPPNISLGGPGAVGHSIRRYSVNSPVTSVSLAMIRNSDAERLFDNEVVGILKSRQLQDGGKNKQQEAERVMEIAEGRSLFKGLVAMSTKYEKKGKVDPLFNFVQKNIKQKRIEKKRQILVSTIIWEIVTMVLAKLSF